MAPHNGVHRRSFESQPLDVVFRALLFVFVAAITVLELPGAREQRSAPDPGLSTQDMVVQSVAGDGPNAGRDIRPGDVIVAIDGEPVRNHIHYRNILAHNTKRLPQEFTLERDGVRHTVSVAYQPTRFTFRDVAFPLVAFFFLVVGLWVYLRRPDAIGSLFAANCAMLASFLVHSPSVPSPALQLAEELVQDAVILYFPATLLHFFLLFPGRMHVRAGASWRRVVLVYAAPTVLCLTSTVLAVRRFGLHAVPDVAMTTLLAASAAYFPVYVLISLVAFVRGYLASPPAQKQRLRVVMAGAIAGFGPFVALTVYRSLSSGEATILEPAAAVSLIFVPATFAYAILKHGAIELNVVVRKSLVYAFLSAAIIACYYGVVHLLGEVVMGEFGVSNAVVLPVAALVLAFVFAPAREHIQRVVDRLFYRGEYVFKQEVYDFNRQLSRRLSKDEIYACFFDRCESLLRPSYVAVYAGASGRAFDLDRATGGAPEVLPPVFSMDCFLGRYFSRYKTPLMVEFLDASWERPNLDLESRNVLSIPSLAVCVPLLAPDRFVGVVLLGGKLSGAAYRRADAELLETFADQLALVLQNAELLQSSLEKERLKGEVMLAREIQLSLLPDTAPARDSIEMRGQMESSFEVGGDYFDYFAVDDDHTGVAIGDVSGKGVPAAMLMSSIQAVFKNLALKSRLSPAEVIAELSNHLFENAKPHQFATFFYGVFEHSTSTFAFSNAGHCPTLLLRAGGGYADRLGKGGLVLGVRRDQGYAEGTVALEPGDLMLLYTDGVTEQKDDAGEEYGEKRLISFLKAHANLPVEALQSALIDDVLAFGEGRQDDDITTVIARKKTA